ncbi:TrkH family potassium uptake protein [Rubrivirga sp.]|uniref:TrkH family potassium uptake protein n=1 Tax=Rubrivirga sp. TaxID=1885344 RepID=UPI003C73C870
MSPQTRFRASVARTVRGVHPVRLVLFGYLTCVVVAWVLLSLPWAQAVAGTSALDHLFIATSAVSTTGLATVSPPGTYSLFGELVILLFIQIGGIGYMSLGSFIVLSRGRRLSKSRTRMLSADFAMPRSFALDEFVRGVIVFTLLAETLGALALWGLFSSAGVENAFYQAVFHSISAFCTAGFSLFDTSLEAFAGNAGVNFVVAALAYLGAIGFIVAVDVWRVWTGKQPRLTTTSRIILRLTALLTVGGTVGLFLIEGDLLGPTPALQWLAAFFQAMTAMTTVGFNTVPIGGLIPGALFLVILLMVVGASPSGTGGGVKTTTISAVYAVVRSVLRGEDDVTYRGQRVPIDRVLAAVASLAFYATVLIVGLLILSLTETADFQAIAFEATSALGTVGLSAGITGDLTDLGKLTIVGLMFAGRLGPLSFGSALFLRDATPAVLEDEVEVIL